MLTTVRGKTAHIKGTFLPAILLVATSWTGFFITHSALMPRIAVGFVSFLTLTNWASDELDKIPDVTYSVSVLGECM